MVTLTYIIQTRDRCGRDRVVVGLTTTCVISAYYPEVASSNLSDDEVYSMQHFTIKCGRFPPPINLTAMILQKYYWKWH